MERRPANKTTDHGYSKIPVFSLLTRTGRVLGEASGGRDPLQAVKLSDAGAGTAERQADQRQTRMTDVDLVRSKRGP